MRIKNTVTGGMESLPAVGPRVDPVNSMFPGVLGPPPDNTVVKWGSLTSVISERPERWRELRSQLIPMQRAPAAHDVVVARVVRLGRHTGIELDSGRKARFFLGDVMVGAFGNRYATRQFWGTVPPLQDTYDMLSQGGVVGKVVSAPERFAEPTILEPLGYLADFNGRVVNLRRYGMRPARSPAAHVPTILVVGSSMDAGKTTMAASMIHGLSHAGCRVHAGKITGTACVKDLNHMRDAGAARVIDFARAGFASTAGIAEEELHDLARTLISNLSLGGPDFLVLEIADGLLQRETRLLMKHLTGENLVDHVCLAVHDAMALPTGLDWLKSEWGVTPTLISGAATASPLSTAELQSLTELPCLTSLELATPSVESRFDNANARRTREASCQMV